jgi:hypothetical protein
MAQSDLRRFYMVIPYLYPDLINDGTSNGDYQLINNGDDTGTYLVWNNDEITEPTEQEISDAKEEAINAWWWKRLRKKRDKLLADSDWSQGADIPSDLKTPYATYRIDLRNLPTTVTKPSFETLNNLSNSTFINNEWHPNFFMPAKPE